jgi:hypothetical protein
MTKEEDVYERNGDQPPVRAHCRRFVSHNGPITSETSRQLGLTTPDTPEVKATCEEGKYGRKVAQTHITDACTDGFVTTQTATSI